MKTIDKLSFVPLLALLLFAGSCEKDGGVFMRENDAIACDCTEQSISQNVLCDGEWVADCGDVGWIAITPERGSGNGKDYGFFTLNIQYNSGAERTATVHLVYDGAAYPITVTQGACEFAYGEPRVEGNLFRNIESTATLRLPYVCASGRESVEISCTITGAAADGLSVTKQVYTGFAKGSGELTIPVEGAATRAGAVAFELFADGVSVGSCRANVISDPDAVPEGLPVGYFSLGMKQRLGIAAALMGRPRLLLLDEPTNGLDPSGIQEMRELIRSLPSRYGMTVIVSSHLLGEIDQMADHVGVIRRGRLKYQGTMSGLHGMSAARLALRTQDNARALRLLPAARSDGQWLMLDAMSDGEAARISLKLAEAGIGLVRMEQRETSLEDIFLRLTGTEETL